MNGFFALLVVLTAVPGSAGDNLLGLGLFEDAATEYLRELHSGAPDSSLLHIKLGFALAGAGELEQAAVEFRAAATDGETAIAAASALAGMFAELERHERARIELAGLAAFVPEPDRVAVELRLAWLDLVLGNLSAARARYAGLGRDDVAARLEQPPPRRSPELAIALSSLVPGSGELYAGRPARGFLSLLVTGASATGSWYAARSGDWVTAGVVFSLLFLRFYAGSRANAADCAEAFNRSALGNYAASVGATAGVAPDWFGPAEQVTGLGWPRPRRAVRR
ncbi:MAG: hypothetical protein R6X12_02445 [bacterium]